MAKIFQNFGNKVGNAFTNLGQGNSLLANQSQISNLSDEDRKKLQQQGLQKFADTMFLTSAIGSGDAQKIALAQNKIRQRQLDEEDAKRKADTETFLENNPQFRQAYELKNLLGIDANTDKTSLERFGVYNKDTKQLIGTVAKSNSVKINELENTPGVVVGQLRSPTVTSDKTGSLLQVVDENNNYVRNISTQEFLNNGLKPGEKLTNLPTGTSPADSGDAIDFDPIKSKYLATENIILQTSELAKQFADNPTSALAVGGVSQFVDSVIQNIDAGSKILSSAKDKKAYKFIQSTSKSIEGNDFGDRIKETSQSTGVAESRIRDLAYLFAAARGQEGRGLSDKDYENALRIVSGGVGAEGRIKVLEDVSNRIKSEFERSIEFDLNMSDDEEYLNKLKKLKPLPTFVNPINTNNLDPLGIL